jgi:hypothetical protein
MQIQTIIYIITMEQPGNNLTNPGNDYNQDVFGNKSSTRKRASLITKFTLFLIAIFWLAILVKIIIGTPVVLDWSLVGLFAFTILTLFTAAFAPQAFAQSQEWMAFAEKLKKE